MSEPVLHSAVELGELYRQRSLSPLEVARAHLELAERLNPALGAYVTLTPELALEQAAAAEGRFLDGEPLGPLDGIPIAIKDLDDHVAGVPSSHGIPALRDYVPEEDALYVRHLREAGGVFLGKTNAPELGHKGVTDNRVIGPTSTPFDLERNAGGSSGGAAASVAAFLATLAQGSDGGGSIRIPAANCGVFGYKASFGAIPLVLRPNAFGAAAPFAHVGPLARTVADARLMLDALVGPSPRDPFSQPPLDFAGSGEEVRDLRIAYSPDLGVFAVDPEVADCVEQAVAGLAEAGARVERVHFALPLDQQELAGLWVRQVGLGLALELHELPDEAVEQLPPEPLSWMRAARSRQAVEVKADDVLRTRVLDAVEDLFERYDVLACPTLTVPPVPNRSDGRTVGPREVNGRPVEPCIGWCMTHPFNFTGHPAASLPAGQTPDGLPVGLQLVGRRHRDATLLDLCAAYESARPWLDDLLAISARLNEKEHLDGTIRT